VAEDTAKKVAHGLLTPLLRQRAGEQLADRLVTALALGEFSPGERLPSERDLAAQLQTSRATVADALRQLTASGHVEVRRGRLGGAYVLDTWTATSAEVVQRTLGALWPDVEQHQDFRGLVEGLVARTAATRRTSQDLEVMQAALDAFGAASSLEQARVLDVRLHRAVAAATHNRDLAALSEQLQGQTTLGFALEPFTDDVFARALPQHEILVAAVTEGDADLAAETATHHFALTTAVMRDLLRRSGGAQA
jgi:GntR family transcriptional repressor for pyruvate dehydrogenase complex